MSKLDWDEVKQLAADFQRAQLNSSLQKLSERNVIEIVTKLIEKKLITLYFTNDGKEYLTPAQLRQEIIDETYLAKGRINLVDLANLLNVNLSLVQSSGKMNYQTKIKNNKCCLALKTESTQIISNQLDWDEVKQLAADFQRAQLNSSLQKLSERNVIEIVTKLIEKKLITLYFTNDGKEYLTPAQLRQEIIDETYLAKGRINLVDLANLLNVNLSLVQSQCNDIQKTDKDYQIVLGQLIHSDYVRTVAVEINELLAKNGSVTIGELTKSYGLPGDFLLGTIESHMNTIIKNAYQDKTDARLFYTASFINRNRSLIRGALLAINKPTQLNHIVKLVNVDLHVFNIIIDELLNAKQIGGQLSNRNSLNSCVYIPHHYIKEQNEYIDNFFKVNNYLEYDNLKRYNISEPVTFIKKHFASIIDRIVFLNSCCVNDIIVDQIVSNIEEMIDTDSLLDVSNIVPSIFNDEDISEMITYLFKHRDINRLNNLTVYLNSILVSDNFIGKIRKPFASDGVLKDKCDAIVKSGDYLKFILKNSSRKDEEEKVEKPGGGGKKEERRKKAASGKAGGGAQGRETKMKSVKNKMRAAKQAEVSSDEDFDGEDVKLKILTKADIKEFIEKENLLNDVDLTEPDEFIKKKSDSHNKNLWLDVCSCAKALSFSFLENYVQNNSSSKRYKTEHVSNVVIWDTNGVLKAREMEVHDCIGIK
ncbi:E3 UFM1-protein ligase 1 homolog [Diaphorina citri]|uniref:E3 UFM1-protein ligase 1 homolog n=1 Tax=Diaphorina citri TaxID=121845 RepID=A0A3Q0JGA4_DIACI|nr:E3 UFM1-protein ligase 1 homolog [Diaphorina citri]